MNIIIDQKFFDGFLCDDRTRHDWDYKADELQNLLDMEKNINH
jgi:hypothetical protein